MPAIIITPIIYLSVFYTLTAPRSSFAVQYSIYWQQWFCTSGMGYLISSWWDQRVAR